MEGFALDIEGFHPRVADLYSLRLVRCVRFAPHGQASLGRGKGSGQGTGLGLLITYDIVTRARGGMIAVDREVDNFTEFVVTMPRGMFANEASQV